MKDLDKLIRLAKARLDRKSTDRGNIPKWQQTKKLDAFAAKVKSMLDPNTWAAAFPRENVRLKGGPALQFWVDKDSPQEQRLVLRAIKGGFELDGPGNPVLLADDDQFNDRLLVAIGDAMETVKQK